MGQASRGCTRTHGIARLASRFMRVAAAHKLLRQNQRAASPVGAPVEAPRAPLLASSPAAGSRKRREVSPVPDDHITILDGLTIHPAVYICLVRRAGGDHAVIDLGAAIS